MPLSEMTKTMKFGQNSERCYHMHFDKGIQEKCQGEKKDKQRHALREITTTAKTEKAALV